MNLAVKHNVVIIPYGGGTNVTNCLTLSPKEKRMIVSVDMARMNRVKHVNLRNMTALVEVGVVGIELESQLEKYGVTCGHEPV